VASHSHPAAAGGFLAASPRTLLDNWPARPGGHLPWPIRPPPACPVPGRLPAARVLPGTSGWPLGGPPACQAAGSSRSSSGGAASWPSRRARPAARPFRLFTSAFADQHLAAV